MVADSRWITIDGKYCKTTVENIRDEFPAAVKYDGARFGVVRVRKSAVPVEIEFWAWSEVDEEGRARGESEPVSYTFSPLSDDSGEPIGWKLRFPLPMEGERFWQLTLTWRDEEGCPPQPDLGSQYVAWRFHTKRR